MPGPFYASWVRMDDGKPRLFVLFVCSVSPVEEQDDGARKRKDSAVPPVDHRGSIIMNGKGSTSLRDGSGH
ncbi:uncharacterized protein CCOS01_05071 [Colletotrichum costaricense]|uniref:Uncharacterized protein n=1 Tax=Colletotrichum costaricense TaxID=1209916 RepID=A0AAJ0E4L2_9PEZI|nr:uncharacterized protein CCOS01_05071 [Colletotrichum costaricense]KAK1533088.1 hypothetical protein CCOS01_05071 [Colletotrichum costaricense]